MQRTILEPAQEVKVCAETDVLVVGGGPAGVAAAVAAARHGAKTVLVERYGHLGGMATGGLVILIPHMSDGTSEQQIAGICQEMIDRLDVLGGALHPSREELGSTDEQVVRRWSRYFSCVVDGRVRQSVMVDPELLKCALNQMVVEAGVKLYLHSWGSRPVVEDNRVTGVIFESKSGRQGILAPVTIDTTGDGDIFAAAGADFDARIDRELRSSQLALVFRLAQVDFHRFCDFREAEPTRYAELMKDWRALAGFQIGAYPSNREDVVWVNNWLPGYSALNVEDLTAVELQVRKVMLTGHAFLKKNMPGFEDCFILDTASQIGTRGSRRLAGEYTLTGEDIRAGATFSDAIALFPRIRGNQSSERRNVQIPYRVLVPRTIEGLLAAGRNFSSDALANNTFNLIPHCAALGEAAGTAAALALDSGTSLRNVDVKALQRQLTAQGVPLFSSEAVPV